MEQLHDNDRGQVLTLLTEREGAARADPRWQPLRAALAAAPPVTTTQVILNQPVVEFGRAEELTQEQRTALETALRAFMPWKKGPFRIFGIEIDAEWRSDQKWARLAPHLKPLAGRRVADIGCHNGYFMYRMAAENPAVVVGIEPVARHWLNFQLLQRYGRVPNLEFKLLGVEHMDLFPEGFDTIFCLGILYHHTDPVGLLRKIRTSLAPGGELIVDCQGIPGDDPVALCPEGRYAKARGIWWLPTRSCLSNWMRRAGFQNVECIYQAPLETTEQRATEWAPVDSLVDFLDPDDPTRTIEGHPAPHRIYMRCDK